MNSGQISMGEAAAYSALGMGMVFFALIVLMGLVKLLQLFAKKREARFPAEAENGEETVRLGTVSDKTAALLMAIVAEESGVPINELRFLSLREVGGSEEERA